ncbi:hypothetical protein [Burkholderia lata]|nr:hypothetical protein [Burkholderia lata]
MFELPDGLTFDPGGGASAQRDALAQVLHGIAHGGFRSMKEVNGGPWRRQRNHALPDIGSREEGGTTGSERPGSSPKWRCVVLLGVNDETNGREKPELRPATGGVLA